MVLVSSTIPNLVNGVSQQPDSLRLTSQCALQDNAYSTIVKGVRKRPPTRHLAQVFNAAGHDNDFTHTINRDAVERYSVIIANGDLKVFALADGTPRTVIFPNGKAYLTASMPNTSFVALTVADYTFVVNNTITCAMDGSLSPVRTKDALIYAKQGSYGSTYSITVTVGGTNYTASYTTSNTDPTTIPTNVIASALNTSLTSVLPGGFTHTVQGSVVHLVKTTGDFTITSSDPLAGEGLIVVKDTIQNFTDLPPVGVNGFQVLVTGDANSLYNGYYVKYVDANTASGSGSWTETTGEGIQNTFDATTMPWQLVRNSDGTFTFSTVAWLPRSVGDNTSAPQPSFVGRKLANIYFHRDRLGFTAGENAQLSKVGGFFNFWPQTVTTVLDSDPIDVAVTDVKVSTIRAVTPYSNDLLLFSDQTQFNLSASNLLTPNTVTVLPTAQFENNSAFCRPISTGKNVYFTIARGAYTGLREYSTLSTVSDVNDAPEVTSHVPTYIPSGVFKMAYTSNESVIAMLTMNQRNVIYVYKYFWNGDTKLQSAWSTFTLDANDIILNIDFIQTDMYLLIQRADGVYLEVMSIELGRVDIGFSFQVNLDRRVYLTGSYNSGTNLTTWTLPYADPGNDFQVVLGDPSFGTQVGTVLTTSMPTTSTVTAVGNYSSGPAYIGRAYTMRYRFSHMLIRERNPTANISSAGPQANVEGRIQLNRFSVTFEQSGYFRAEVTPYARPLRAYVFTGYIAGDQQALIGTRPVVDGIFRFPIQSESRTVQVDLVNDTYLPSNFQQLGWEGKYYARSQRV